jgi:hypothetical protein
MSGQLALVSLDSQTAAIDLVSNPSQPKRLCMINNVFNRAPAAAGGPRFVGRSEVSYVDQGLGGILRLNLATGISTTVVSWNSGGLFPFGDSGGYGWSPDGQSLAYMFDPQTGSARSSVCFHMELTDCWRHCPQCPDAVEAGKTATCWRFLPTVNTLHSLRRSPGLAGVGRRPSRSAARMAPSSLPIRPAQEA